MWLYQRDACGYSPALGALSMADHTERSSRDAWYLQYHISVSSVQGAPG